MASRTRSGCFSAMLLLMAILEVYWAPVISGDLQKSVLAEDSKLFNIWRKTSVPTYLEVYFFNITNVDDILARKQGIKIQVKEMGPYVFREISKKTNLTWNANSTLTFYNQKWWHFVPVLSTGLLSDEIVNVNPLIAEMGVEYTNIPKFLRLAVNSVFQTLNADLFVKGNVSSWLFDGVSDPIQAQLDSELDLKPLKRFAWFYGRNGSVEYDGPMTINTGATDLSQLGNVESWRFSNRTAFRDECGEVKGSTGELWAPEYGKEEMSVFVPDLCTHITLFKEREVSSLGVNGVQYAASDVTFDNGQKYPRQSCFCDAAGPPADCLPAGVLNITGCHFNGPVFVSLPHFLYADSYYTSKIEGLTKANEYMNYRVVIDKTSGLPLSTTVPLQYNLLIRQVPNFEVLNTLPDADTLVPMFWYRQQREITPKYVKLLKNLA